MGKVDSFDLSGRKAIVTGAGTGLGRAMAMALAEAGADVAIPDIDLSNAERVAEEIKKLGRHSLSLKTDVTKPTDVDTMVHKTLEQFGRIDILVNNAGICITAPLESMKLEDYDAIMDVDVRAVLLCSQAVGREMIKQRSGNIINMGSISGIVYNKRGNMGIYCVAKAAVMMLTKALAAEWAKYNIRVNAMAPGYFLTDLSREFLGNRQIRPEIMEMTPMKRHAEPKELAGTVVYLASNASEFVTGQAVVIDGGWTIW